MALIDLALLNTEKVYVDTTSNPDSTDLVGLGALSAPTVVYYGNGSVDLNTVVGVGALSNDNTIATGGADVTIGAGLLDVSLLTSQNLLIDGDSSITLKASGVSIGTTLTGLLNNTTVAFSGSGAGTFTFTPPTLGVLSTTTINVAEMGAGDKIVIPYSGDGLLGANKLRETGYNSTTGYLTLTNGAAALGNTVVNIKMTQAQYNIYAASKSQYLNGTTDTFTFPGTPDPNEPPYVIPCFTRGTMIATVDGDVAVEDLKVGDLVLTKDHGAQPIRWIGSKQVDNLCLSRNEKLRPVRIKKGALGANLPSADLLVSPQHRVLIRSAIAKRMFGSAEVLIAAKQLLQVQGIDIATDVQSVEYFHILFDHHEVITSNGAETESLYTGKEAVRALAQEAVEEIMSLFPELRDESYRPDSARNLPTGRQGRKLAVRHVNKGRPLVVA